MSIFTHTACSPGHSILSRHRRLFFPDPLGNEIPSIPSIFLSSLFALVLQSTVIITIALSAITDNNYSEASEERNEIPYTFEMVDSLPFYMFFRVKRKTNCEYIFRTGPFLRPLINSIHWVIEQIIETARPSPLYESTNKTNIATTVVDESECGSIKKTSIEEAC